MSTTESNTVSPPMQTLSVSRSIGQSYSMARFALPLVAENYLRAAESVPGFKGASGFGLFEWACLNPTPVDTLLDAGLYLTPLQRVVYSGTDLLPLEETVGPLADDPTPLDIAYHFANVADPRHAAFRERHLL